MTGTNIQMLLRRMKKRLFHSAANFIGAGIGTACLLLIVIYVKNELSVDQHQPYKKRIYRIALTYRTNSGNDFQSAENFLALAPTLQNDFPEVEEAIRLVPYRGDVTVLRKSGDNTVFPGEHIYRTDPNVFNVFKNRLIEGDIQALSKPHTVVHSQSLAKKYFGSVSPLNKALTIDHRTYAVKGVMEDVPRNSDLYYEALLSFDFTPSEDWGNPQGYTYALLKKGHDLPTFQEKLDKLVVAKTAFLSEYGMKGSVHLYPQPLSTLHFAKPLSGDTPKGNMTYVRVLIVLSVVIFMIVAFNVANFTASFYTERIHEVSVRKYLGAGRMSLFFKFLIEGAFGSLAVATIAVTVTVIFIPSIDLFVSKGLGLHSLYDPTILLAIAGFAIVLCLLSLLYPSIYLLQLHAFQGLKGTAKFDNIFFRKVMIGVQFFFTSAVVFFTLVVYFQMKYLENKKLGFSGSHVMVVAIPAGSVETERLPVLKSELQNQGSIEQVSLVGSNAYPGKNKSDYQLGWIYHHNNRVEANFNLFEVDENFIDVLHISLLAGENFDVTLDTDGGTGQAIVNEAFVRMAGFTSAEEALGKIIYQFDTKAEIVGVAANFHYEGIQQSIKPLVLEYSKSNDYGAHALLVGIGNEQGIAAVERFMQRGSSETSFDFTFLDEQFAQLYQQEKNIGSMTRLVSWVAILLAGFGLYTLSSLLLQQRTKEIGIRKILGASISSISLLLSREFLWLALISFVVAIPFAWYESHVWLREFAYRIPIGGFFVVFSLLITICIVFFGVLHNLIKGIAINPSECLKDE